MTAFTPPQAFLFLQRLYSQFPFMENQLIRIPMPPWYAEWKDKFTDEERVELARYINDDSDGTDLAVIIPWSRSKAVALASCFAMFCTRMMPDGGRMGFAFTANLHGSGKSLLAKIPIYATGGLHYESWRSDDEKMRTALDACAQNAVSSILFDNAPPHIPLASPSLEAFMTMPTWSGRTFGKNDTRFNVAIAATIFITANSLNLNADLSRRFLQCNLFVSEGNIQDRAIADTSYLDDEILATPQFRQDLLGALWTMIDCWAKDKQPKAKKHLRQGFKTWCQLIGGIVLSTGFGDCLVEPEASSTSAGKEETQAHTLIEHIAKLALTKNLNTPRIALTLEDIIQHLHTHGLWEWLLDGKEETIREEKETYIHFHPTHPCKVKVGRYLAKYAPHRDPSHPNHYRIYRFDTADLGTWTACTEGTGKYKKFVIEKAS
jgi:hypothetical protein